MKALTVLSKIQTGQLRSLPKQMTIDLKGDTREDFQAVLEVLRYKSFGHDLLQREVERSQQTDETALKSAIHNGKFEEASRLLTELRQDQPESLELKLQELRILGFKNRFPEILSGARSLLSNGALPPASRGVTLQIYAHALMESGECAKAEEALRQAIEIAQLIGNPVGTIAALLFLAKTHAICGRAQAAQSVLSEALNVIIEGSLGFRWLLGYFRTASHCDFFEASPSCIDQARAALLIAWALGDELHRARGLLELKFMAAGFSVVMPELTSEEATILERQLALPDSNLKAWTNAWENRETRGPSVHAGLTLERFLAAATQAPSNKTVLWRAPSIRPQWVFDSRSGVLVDLKGCGYARVPAESPTAQLIALLAQSPKFTLPQAEAFEKCWNLPFKPHRHRNTLGVSIVRANRLIPSLKITRKGGLISLSPPGLLC